MSIRFNHTANTQTVTGTLSLIVEGGTPASPRPIRLQASSVIMPVRPLPSGEAGSVVFDTTSKTLKYHNGTSWVELLSADVILSPIYTELNNINTKLNRKIETVTYSSSAIGTASISGTNLNIVFPSGGSVPSTIPGLFTALPPGSVVHYSLVSGQSIASIREQMSGVAGGQNGRNGTQANPYITQGGFCLADGLWWQWNGESGTVLKQVPNLNRGSYLKCITTTGVTSTNANIAASGTLSSTAIAFPDHYHGVGGMVGISGSQGDDGIFITGKVWNDGRSYTGAMVTGDNNKGLQTSAVNGTDTRTAFSTTYAVAANGGAMGSTTSNHTHQIQSIDVQHLDVAALYSIANPSTAMNQAAADKRYVLKSGDTMTGSLTIANEASITSNAATLPLWFRNSSNSERGVLYHNSSTNSMRMRANGGPELNFANTGELTIPTLTVSTVSAQVSGKNIVRSINNINADGNGNVTLTLQQAAVTNMRLGVRVNCGVSESPYYPGHVMTGWRYGDKKELRGASYWSAPLQYLLSGVWITIQQL